MGRFEVNKFQASLPVHRKARGETNMSFVTSAWYGEVHDVGRRESHGKSVTFLRTSQSESRLRIEYTSQQI